MKSDAVVGGVAQGETAGSANHRETPPQAPHQETAPVKGGGLTRPGRVRRFFWSVVSHVVFASIIVAGVLGYLYQREILGRLGDELCRDARLGQYMTKPRTAAAGAPILAPGVAPNTATPQMAAPSAGEPSPVVSPAPAEKAPAVETPATAPAPAPVASASEPAAGAPAQAPGPAEPVVAPVPSPAAPGAGQTPSATLPAVEQVTPAPTATTAAPPAPASPSAVDTQSPPAAPGSKGSPVVAAPVEASPAPAPVAAPALPVEPAVPERLPSSTEPPSKAAAAVPAEKAAQVAAAERAPTETKNTPPFNPSVLNSEWQAARRAYVEGKSNAADLYRELVTKYPDIADLRGELGNVLYAGGQSKEAAEQYYEAALRHLKGPQPELAACLVDVVKKIDSSRGGDLEKRVTRPCPYPRGK